ncbi:conserved protein of unknown function [Tenacibaculum soleae]|uniref:hypothetical protein n=1 Tax=Tenacibaculum soleae TaxID=447689 RepID=UPI003AB3496C
MSLNKITIILFFILTLTSCKDYYNDTIAWMDNLESELTIENVQKSQPDYIEIDWENPQNFDKEKWYLITEIKGNNDILGMSHFLVFVDNKYKYRESKK